MSVVREVLGDKYEQYVVAGSVSRFRGVAVNTLSRDDLYVMIAKQNELLETATAHLFEALLTELVRDLPAAA